MKRKVWEVLGMVVIMVLLVLGIQVLLRVDPGTGTLESPRPSPRAHRDEIMPTVTPVRTVVVPESAPTSAAGTPIPICVFDQQMVSPTVESRLDKYVLSAPQIVLTSESAIDIVDWLPDGQRLLLTRFIPNQARHYIETFDMPTHNTVGYGESIDFTLGFNGANKPLWLASEQAVAYVELTGDNEKILYINHGGETPSVELTDDLMNTYLATRTDGREILYFAAADSGQPQLYELASATIKTLATELHLPIENIVMSDYHSHYQMALHPNGQQVAFYNNTGFYLADLVNNQICKIDLGQYGGYIQRSLLTHWSPDGQYLAVFVTGKEPMAAFIGLVLIDLQTGVQRPVNIANYRIYAATWAPNSRDMLIVAANLEADDTARHYLFLVDSITGNVRPILANYPFMYTGFSRIAWSPTTNAIALNCAKTNEYDSRITQGQLCIILMEANN